MKKYEPMIHCAVHIDCLNGIGKPFATTTKKMEATLDLIGADYARLNKDIGPIMHDAVSLLHDIQELEDRWNALRPILYAETATDLLNESDYNEPDLFDETENGDAEE